MDDHTNNQQTLSQILSEAGKLETSDATRIIGQILESLHGLHQSNQIHRNVCGGEIFIDQQGNASLSDPLQKDVNCSVLTPELESLNELSLPPQIDQAAQRVKSTGVSCDPRRIDLFAVGQVAIEMISAGSIDDYLSNQTTKNDVDANLQNLIDAALGLNPKQRAVTANELILQLNASQSNQVTIAPTVAPTIAPTIGISSKTSCDNFELSPSTLQNQSGTSDNDATQGSSEQSVTSFSDGVPFENLGQYKIIRQLGQGGMGAVFLASDQRLERSVALKVLPPNLASNPNFVERFKNEARSAAKLEHPHIVPIYNIDEDQGYHFFVMQYVEGKSLAEILSKERKLDEASALRIVEQIASGLVEAHGQGLIHRDIKPANIMVQSKDNKAMLADFGLVKSNQSVLGATATGVIMGTVNYISPEQGRGQKIDGRSDLYSLGVTLYRILAGRLPFHAENATAMIFQHVYEPPTPIQDLTPELSAEMIAVVERLLQKEPDRRYQNAQDLVNDVQAIRSGQSLTGHSPNNANVRSAFNIGQLDDWMKDWDDSAAELASGPINENEEARLLALFDDNAPLPIQRLKNAYQQVKGGLAVYTTRRKELVETIAETEDATQQIETKIIATEKLVVEADQRLSDLTAGPDKDTAQQQADNHRTAVIELTQVMSEQKSDSSEVRKKLEHVDKTIDDLQQQQRMLMARLKKAEAQLGANSQAAKATSSRLPLLAGLTTVALALVVGLVIAWPRLFPPSGEPNVDKPDSNLIAGVADFPASAPFETTGSETRGPTIFSSDGLIDYRHFISLAGDTDGENWQRDDLDILLNQPSASNRLAIPVLTTKDYDLEIEYTTTDGAFEVAIPIGTSGLTLLRLGHNNGNGIELLGLTGTKSSNDRGSINKPSLQFDHEDKNQVLIWIQFTDEGLATLTVSVNDAEVFHRERAEKHFEFSDPIAQHSLGAVPMIIGNAGSVIAFGKLGVRCKSWKTNIIRKLQPPLLTGSEPLSGLKFTSSDKEIVTVGDFNYTGDHPLTAEAWVTPEEKTNAHVVSMFPVGNVGIFSIKIGDRGHWEFSLYHHGNRKGHLLTSKEPVAWDERCHVAAIFDNGQIELFVNGVSQGKSEQFNDVKPKGEYMRIGSNCYWGGKNHFFKGTIEQLRVSRVRVYDEDFTPANKLSADENSMAMFNFNEKFGRLVIDQSGNEPARLKVDMNTQRELDDVETNGDR